MTEQEFFIQALKGTFKNDVECFPFLVNHGYIELALVPSYPDIHQYLFTILKPFKVGYREYNIHDWYNPDATREALKLHPEYNPNNYEIWHDY